MPRDLAAFGRAVARRAGQWSAALLSGRRGQWVTIGFVLLSVAVMVGVLRSDWAQMQAYTWQFRPLYLLLTLLCVFATFALTALTWHAIVVRFLPQTTLRLNVKYWAYSNFARRIPGTLWYIASRAALYERHGVSKAAVALLSGLELALILVSGAIVSLATLPFWLAAGRAGSRPALLLTAVLLPVCALLVSPGLLNRVWRRLNRGDVAIRPLRWADTLLGVGLYLVIWVVGALAFFCIVNVVHPLSIDRWGELLNIWAVSNTISFAGSLTLSAIGVRDVSLTLLMTALAPPQAALLATILTRVLWLGSELLAGVFSLALRPGSEEATAASDPAQRRD